MGGFVGDTEGWHRFQWIEMVGGEGLLLGKGTQSCWDYVYIQKVLGYDVTHPSFSRSSSANDCDEDIAWGENLIMKESQCLRLKRQGKRVVM